MIVYEQSGNLIVTRSIKEDSNEVYKHLIQMPENIEYGDTVYDIGHMENGQPVFDNNISYIEGEEIKQEIVEENK